MDRSHRGFTLIEIMIVVVIIGLLSSIAIPSFERLQLRSKQAERRVMVTAIRRGIDELWLRNARFPVDLGGGDSMLLLPDQPDPLPSPLKVAWRRARIDPTDGWNDLAMSVDGGVYFRYGGYAIKVGNRREYYVFAAGDLDGDGVVNRWRMTWTWLSGAKQVQAGLPADWADCSAAVEDNPLTF